MKLYYHYVASFLLLVLAACGGDGGSSLSPAPDTDSIEATSMSIQSNIFNVSCAVSGCHAGAAPTAGMSLEADVSFSNLIGVTSIEDGNFERVKFGDPDNSYLVQKLEGTASTGGRMPLGRPALPQQQITAVRTWITNGAIIPTLQSIQDQVFTPTCAVSGCHTGGAPAADMNLDNGNSFTSLVGVSSIEDNNFQRVNAGDPDNSYLIQKLEGTASVGERMPRGGAPLPDTTIKTIRQWITDGANP